MADGLSLNGNPFNTDNALTQNQNEASIEAGVVERP